MADNNEIDGPTWVRLFEIPPSTKIEKLECVRCQLSCFWCPVFVTRLGSQKLSILTVLSYFTRRSMENNPKIDGPTWARLFEILPSTKIEALKCVCCQLSCFCVQFL